jgi:hypothetical protein
MYAKVPNSSLGGVDTDINNAIENIDVIKKNMAGLSTRSIPHKCSINHSSGSVHKESSDNQDVNTGINLHLNTDAETDLEQINLMI